MAGARSADLATARLQRGRADRHLPRPARRGAFTGAGDPAIVERRRAALTARGRGVRMAGTAADVLTTKNTTFSKTTIVFGSKAFEAFDTIVPSWLSRLRVP